MITNSTIAPRLTNISLITKSKFKKTNKPFNFSQRSLHIYKEHNKKISQV